MERKKLVINRSEWLSGDFQKIKPHGSSLYDNYLDRFCCLGLICRDLANIPTEKMKYVGSPAGLNVGLKEIEDFEKLRELGLLREDNKHYFNTDETILLIAANDNPSISDELREKEITVIFSKLGIDVEFMGELYEKETNV